MGRFLLRAIVALILVFLMAPVLSIAISSFSTAPLFSFPPRGFTLRWYEAIPLSYLTALEVSVVVAIGTTALALAVGVPAALALVRGQFPVRRLLSTLCLSPLMVPTLVTGVAAFQLAMVLFDTFGFSLLETELGLILGHTAFTVPFVIRSVIAGQVQFDRAAEEAAMSLGATPLRTFFTVTVPMLSPAIASGAIFAFLMSFDDVPVAMFIGGGDVTTLPVRILNSIQFDLSPAVLALCTIVAVTVILLVALCGRLFGLDKFFGTAQA